MADVLPDLNLTDRHGNRLALSGLLASGPAVLYFLRTARALVVPTAPKPASSRVVKSEPSRRSQARASSPTTSTSSTAAAYRST